MTDEERDLKIEQDSYALAQLIYDIYIEKKREEHVDNDS